MQTQLPSSQEQIAVLKFPIMRSVIVNRFIISPMNMNTGESVSFTKPLQSKFMET